MGTVVLLIDNSNIFISGKEKYGDMSARFSYSEFEKICAGDDAIVEKLIAGSTPPSNDRFWTRMEKNGYKVHTYERVSAGYGHTKEKGVDTVLAMKGTRAIEKLKPSRVVLLTGDADFIPIAGIRDDIRDEEGDSFILDVWAFSNSMSPELERVSDRVFKIDDHQEKLIYFQGQDGRTEGFNEHYARIAEEKAAAERETEIKTEQIKIEEDKAATEKNPISWFEKRMAEKGAALKAEQIKIEEDKAATEKESMSWLEKAAVGGAILAFGLGALAAIFSSDSLDY